MFVSCSYEICFGVSLYLITKSLNPGVLMEDFHSSRKGDTHVGCQLEHGVGNCPVCNADSDGYKKGCIERWAAEDRTVFLE